MRGTVLLGFTTLLALLGLGVGAWSHAPPPEPRLVLVPMGEVDAALVDALGHALRVRTSGVVRVEEHRPLPAYAWDARTRRYSAEALLRALDEDPPWAAWKSAIVTDAELFSERGRLAPRAVIGSGAVRGPSCVVSVAHVQARSSSSESLVRRLTDVLLHEVGHTVGLHHCGVPGCVMAPAHGDPVVWTDLRRHDFCPLCRLKAGDDLFPAPGFPPLAVHAAGWAVSGR